MKQSTPNFRIGIVDDNFLNRSNFVQKLNQFPEFSLVVNSAGGHEFLESLKGLPSSKLPQVVFMDIEMPDLNGIETIRLAKALYENIYFVILTIFEDDDNIFKAIQSGASGYLLKHESHHSIQQAIHEVVEFGGAPMSPAIARKTLKLLGQQNGVDTTSSTELLDHLLSEREKEVLIHMVHGYDAKRIAEIISISTLTVRKHISNIYNKLHVNSKAQVISLAYKNNWL